MEEVIISPKEKRQNFLYVLILFIIAGFFLIWIIYKSNTAIITVITSEKSGHPPDNADLIQVQQEWMPLFDTTMININKYKDDPNNRPEYHQISTIVENDIVRIRNTRSMGSKKDDTTSIRYRSFSQMYNFLILYKAQAERYVGIKVNIKMHDPN